MRPLLLYLVNKMLLENKHKAYLISYKLFLTMLYKKRSLKGCSRRGGWKSNYVSTEFQRTVELTFAVFLTEEKTYITLCIFMWTNLISLLAFTSLFTAQDLIDSSHNYS